MTRDDILIITRGIAPVIRMLVEDECEPVLAHLKARIETLEKDLAEARAGGLVVTEHA